MRQAPFAHVEGVGVVFGRADRRAPDFGLIVFGGAGVDIPESELVRNRLVSGGRERPDVVIGAAEYELFTTVRAAAFIVGGNPFNRCFAVQFLGPVGAHADDAAVKIDKRVSIAVKKRLDPRDNADPAWPVDMHLVPVDVVPVPAVRLDRDLAVFVQNQFGRVAPGVDRAVIDGPLNGWLIRLEVIARNHRHAERIWICLVETGEELAVAITDV